MCDGSSSSDSDRRKTTSTDGLFAWRLHVGPNGPEHPLSASGGGSGGGARAHKWRVAGWVGGLRVKLKEVGMDGKGTLKMFARKKRELIKTNSISKKSRAGSPASALSVSTSLLV
ncbi:hypothetical protein EYF80_023034 [Liparis tanakae]|uniref:Uncharacterized protein n=1 Tax=Liparis tanakae TaxID=230148 RepID=A0A4Z2HPU2_9TELE|nr:hypothetical protein EYF80_023034 [Liparis tanakae]